MSANSWDIEGKWCVSRHCYCDDVLATTPQMRKKVEIRDITFREGDDCIGLRVSVPDKMKLLEKSIEVGVTEVDNGGPSLHQHQWNFCRAIADSGLPVKSTARFFALTDDFKRDVDTCIAAGTSNFRVVSMQLNEEYIRMQMERLPAIIEYIHECGYEVDISMSDSTRAPIERFDAYYKHAIECGADSLNMPDTFGVGKPSVLKYLCERLRKIMPEDMKLVIHMHNTFGLAVANSLACVEGGATVVDGAINGYGDEAGNASFEEIAVALEALYGVDTGLDLTKLNDYCKLYEELGRMPCQPHKAINGRNAFLRPMTVWHGHDMARESWMTHEALSPEAVGVGDCIVFGPEASLDPEPITVILNELGKTDVSAEDIDAVKKAVEDRLEQPTVVTLPTPFVTMDDFKALCKEMFSL